MPVPPLTIRSCPDCAVKPGQPHKDGCDVERCSECGGQRLSCGCDGDGHDKAFARWTGLWPAEAECAALGYYALLIPNVGWQRCAPHDDGATLDLNRFYAEDLQRTFFVKPTVSA